MNPTRLRISNSFPSGFDGLYTIFKNVEPSFAVALSMFNAGNIVISAGPLNTSNPIDRHRRNEKAKGDRLLFKGISIAEKRTQGRIDERISGTGDFVHKIMSEVEERQFRQTKLRPVIEIACAECINNPHEMSHNEARTMYLSI
jgi:hypothetical protein